MPKVALDSRIFHLSFELENKEDYTEVSEKLERIGFVDMLGIDVLPKYTKIKIVEGESLGDDGNRAANDIGGILNEHGNKNFALLTIGNRYFSI